VQTAEHSAVIDSSSPSAKLRSLGMFNGPRGKRMKGVLSAGSLLLALHGSALPQFSIVDQCKTASSTSEDYVRCRASEAAELPYKVQATCFSHPLPAKARVTISLEVSTAGVVTKATLGETNVNAPGFAERLIDAMYRMKIGALPESVSLTQAAMELDLQEVSQRIKIYNCTAFRTQQLQP